MKYAIMLLALLLGFQASGQNTGKAVIDPESASLILYPQIYQVIELEKEQDFILNDLLGFCSEQGLTLIEQGHDLKLFKVYPSFLGYEKSTMDLKENLHHQLGNALKIISIQSYGREYLPDEYLSLINLKQESK